MTGLYPRQVDRRASNHHFNAWKSLCRTRATAAWDMCRVAGGVRPDLASDLFRERDEGQDVGAEASSCWAMAGSFSPDTPSRGARLTTLTPDRRPAVRSRKDASQPTPSSALVACRPRIARWPSPVPPVMPRVWTQLPSGRHRTPRIASFGHITFLLFSADGAPRRIQDRHG